MKMKPSSIKPSCLILLLFTFGCVNVSAQPNILFIVSDDHGWGDLPSNWDNTEVQLPVLEELATGGVRFKNYHTVPLCAPSRACLPWMQVESFRVLPCKAERNPQPT